MIKPRIVAALVLATAALSSARAQKTPGVVKLEPGTGAGWHVTSRSIEHLDADGRHITRFDERRDAGAAWTRELSFTDGDLDFDVKGRDVAQRSFVGVMFHVVDDTTAEIVYLRPFNFQAEDAERRAHAVQYTSYPVFSWQKLRSEHPGMYEAPVPARLNATDWVHVRVSVHGTDVRVYLNGSATPVLKVESLGPNRRGGVGLWVGDQSNGDFANFTVTTRPAN